MDQGVLQLALTWDGSQIVAAGVASSRPLAASCLRGLPLARVPEVVARLFGLCRCAQELAAQLCLQAVWRQGAAMLATATQQLAVALEAIGEHLWRLLLDWPPLCGQAPRQREFLHWRKRLLAVVDGRAAAAFAGQLLSWLDRETPLPCEACCPKETVALLPRASAAEWEAQFEAAADSAGVGFSARPTFAGQPAETGALARRADDPPVAKLLAVGQRSQARLVARYAELRWLAESLTQPERLAPWFDSAMVAEGCGLARVETARGCLLHRVEVDGDRAATYVIVAPTEWNFHPQGAFVRELVGRPAATRAAALIAARRQAVLLDPCVPHEVVVEDA